MSEHDLNLKAAPVRPVARVRFHGLQENFGGGAPLPLFNVVGDALLDGQNFKGSTVTLPGLAARGFLIEMA